MADLDGIAAPPLPAHPSVIEQPGSAIDRLGSDKVAKNKRHGCDIMSSEITSHAQDVIQVVCLNSVHVVLHHELVTWWIRTMSSHSGAES